MSLFSDEHESFRSRARSFVEQNLTPHAEEWERRTEFPQALFRQLSREGFLGLTQHRRYGGQGLDFGYSVVLAEELTRSKMVGLVLSIVAQNHFFLPLLETLGTEEQKHQFMIPAIRGEKVGALASTEPTGGTDVVHAIRCTALDEGENWIITGEKKYITNGPIADFVVTLVRTKHEETPTSLSLIIVPTNTHGFRVKQTLRTLGLHTSPTGWLEFDRCRIPKHLTLGKRDLGFFYATQAFLEERLIGSASALASAGLVLEDTIRHVKQRFAFGGPLSQLQTVRHRISEMAAEIEMAKRFAYSVCESYRDGRTEAKEICMLKFQVPEIVQRIVGQCLQLQGAYGFLEENWITRAYRDARFLSVGGGPSESMKDLVATYLRL